MSQKVIIAISSGDAAGVGPELAIKTALLPELRQTANLVVTGALNILEEARRRYAPEARLIPFPQEATLATDVVYCDFEESLQLDFSEELVAKASAECGQVCYDTIVKTTQAVVDKTFDAIVTAPANKESVNLAGITFQGHTELVAAISGTEDFAMMQSDGPLRVIFVTAHIPLNEVSSTITSERIVTTTQLLNDSIKADGIAQPKIALAGINPHAGEGGYMGREEIDLVLPAMETLKAQGIDVHGPFPADTLFIENIRTQYDGIVSMYHDQGHIPFKMLAFDRGVNSTMGLSIIRTSVDHGTAFNIAWQGKADTGSLVEAIKLATRRAIYKKGQ